MRLGASDVVISTDGAEMRRQRNTFDFILDTVSASHNINEYLSLVKQDGTLAVVGLPAQPFSVAPSV